MERTIEELDNKTERPLRGAPYSIRYLRWLLAAASATDGDFLRETCRLERLHLVGHRQAGLGVTRAFCLTEPVGAVGHDHGGVANAVEALVLHVGRQHAAVTEGLHRLE